MLLAEVLSYSNFSNVLNPVAFFINIASLHSQSFRLPVRDLLSRVSDVFMPINFFLSKKVFLPTLVYKKWPAKEPKLNDEGMTLATYCKTIPYNRA
jgi:hypothetical protein